MCTISAVLSPEVWWCPCVALACLFCGFLQCKQWTYFRGGWLQGTGEEWEELLRYFVHICEINLCLCHLCGAWGLQGSHYLVKGVPGMKDLGHLCFCYLEEHLTTFWKNDSLCVVSVECILFPRLLASGFCTAWQDSRDFFLVFLVLTLPVAKLQEEVLLGWGKVCCGSSCPTRLVPVDCSTQREASCCLHPCLGH